MMKAVYVSVVLQLCLVSFASAQIAEQPRNTDSLIESIPVEVLVDIQGHETLVTEPIEPATLEQIRDRLPYEVLVWSIGDDGERSLGVSFSNSDTKPNYSPLRRYPGSGVLMPDGSWVIDDVMWSLTHSWVRPALAIGPTGLASVVEASTAPDRKLIVCYPSGQTRFDPPAAAGDQDALKGFEVYTELPDGSIRRGVWAMNTSNRDVHTIVVHVPHYSPTRHPAVSVREHFVALSSPLAPGMYCHQTGYESLSACQWCGSATGACWFLDGLQSFQPRDARGSGQSPTRAATLTINYDANAFDQAFGAENRPDFDRLLLRVKGRVESVLSSSRGLLVWNLEFGLLGGAMGAETVTPLATTPLRPLMQLLAVVAEQDNESSAEIVYYEAFLNDTVPWHFSAAQQNLQADIAAFPQTLLTQLFQPGEVPPVTTTINDGIAWDFNSKNGVDEAVDDDLEAVLSHEIIHGLGFVSRADTELAELPSNILFLADVFRFDEDAGSISGSEVRTSPRQLRPDEQANYVFQLNSTTARALAARGTRTGGDDNEAAHWLHFLSLPDQVPIGIMDPHGSDASGSFPAPHPARASRYYLRLPDVRIQDIVGWNINHNAFDDADVPAPAEPQSPADGAIDVPLEPTLEWVIGAFTDSVTVVVASEPDANSGSIVFEAHDLMSGDVTLPGGVLEGGETYYWFTSAVGFYGVTYSEIFMFTTEGGCPADFNNDGVVDTRDMIAFLSAWSAGDPSADFNGDGVVDTRDVIDFLNAWSQGCP